VQKKILRNRFIVDNVMSWTCLLTRPLRENGCYHSCNRRTNQFSESQKQPLKNFFSITQTQQIAWVLQVILSIMFAAIKKKKITYWQFKLLCDVYVILWKQLHCPAWWLTLRVTAVALKHYSKATQTISNSLLLTGLNKSLSVQNI